MQGKKSKDKIKALSRAEIRKTNVDDLPAIPDKRYFTISEASELCAVKAYVLRYWEQEFSQLRPTKRRGNRRYYQLQDILLVRQIRKLLYDDGFTIEGARAKLTHPAEIAANPNQEHEIIKKIINELETILVSLQFDAINTH